jgi:hypothetical protein
MPQGPWGNGSESECGHGFRGCGEEGEQGAVTGGSGWISGSSSIWLQPERTGRSNAPVIAEHGCRLGMR